MTLNDLRYHLQRYSLSRTRGYFFSLDATDPSSGRWLRHC